MCKYHNPILKHFYYSQKRSALPICSHPLFPSQAPGKHQSTFCLYSFAFLDLSHKRNYKWHKHCIFCAWLHSLSVMFLRYIRVAIVVNTSCPFIDEQYSIVYIGFYLSVHQLMKVLAFSSLQLWRIMLPSVCGHMKPSNCFPK